MVYLYLFLGFAVCYGIYAVVTVIIDYRKDFNT